MRLSLVAVAVLVGVSCAENRQKRQASLQHTSQQQQYYPPSQQVGSTQTEQARYAANLRQQEYSSPSQYRQGQKYAYAGYNNPQQQQQHQQDVRQAAQTSRQTPGKKAASQLTSQEEEEEEEEAKPSPLELLLQRSTFKCDGKKDGYYADVSVECKAFHYCIGGAKNSFMCAEGTVFHQVHLNCVPEDQDICVSSESYYFVNDYLNKELEQRGPNNTILYADRYYPEGFVVGDPLPTAPRTASPSKAAAFGQQYDDDTSPAPRTRVVQRSQAQRAPAQAPAVTYRQAQPAAAAGYRQPQLAAQPAQTYDPYAQYRGTQQPGQNPYYRPAASNQQAQYQYEDQSSEEQRGVKYDDE